MTHFLGVLDPRAEVPGPAKRIAEYLGKIIEAATASPPGVWIDTDIRCRRRPGRRPCPGHIGLMRNDIPGEIAWACTSCDDRGSKSGWRGTPWDKSWLEGNAGARPSECERFFTVELPSFDFPDDDDAGRQPKPEGSIEVVFQKEEYAVARGVCRGGKKPMSILARARICPEGFIVKALAKDIEELRDYLFDITATETNRSVRGSLNRILQKMDCAIDTI